MTRRCDCSEAQEALWPPERPRLMAADIEAAARHVEECESCSRVFALDRRLVPAVEALRAQTAPLELRERVFDALAEARAARGVVAAPRTRMTPRRLAFAAGLLVVVMAFVVGPPTVAPARTVATEALVVDDYLRRAVAADRRLTNSPGEVTAFLVRELGVRFRPLAAPGLTLEQVEICLLDGQRSGLIHYRYQGRRVFHYVVPTDQERRTEPVAAERASVGGPEGLPVVSWSTPGLDLALMGDLTSEVLLELASAGG